MFDFHWLAVRHEQLSVLHLDSAALLVERLELEAVFVLLKALLLPLFYLRLLGHFFRYYWLQALNLLDHLLVGSNGTAEQIVNHVERFVEHDVLALVLRRRALALTLLGRRLALALLDRRLALRHLLDYDFFDLIGWREVHFVRLVKEKTMQFYFGFRSIFINRLLLAAFGISIALLCMLRLIVILNLELCGRDALLAM